MDNYRHFEQLREFEKEGVDFRIRWRVENSGIAILSIHGGDIEPGTSEIGDAIAGKDHTFYTFEGIKRAGNRKLHLTSTVFNEPIGLEIVCLSEISSRSMGVTKQNPLLTSGEWTWSCVSTFSSASPAPDSTRLTTTVRNPGKRPGQHLQYLRPRDGNSTGDQQGIARTTV